MAKPTTNVVYPVQVSKGNTLYIEAHGSFLTKKNIQRQLKNLGYKKFTITKPIPLKDFKNMSSKVKTIKLKPAIGELKGVPKPPTQTGLGKIPGGPNNPGMKISEGASATKGTKKQKIVTKSGSSGNQNVSLSKFKEKLKSKVTFIEDTVTGQSESYIDCEKNGQIVGDVIIDCTGFKGELQYTSDADLSNRLICDTAIAGHVEYESEEEKRKYVICEAVSCGWIWKIPVRHRIGTGIVFNKKITSPEEAAMIFTNHWKDRVKIRKVINWTPYYRPKFWKNNVIRIGLSAGFIEPLESTGLALAMEGAYQFVRLTESGYMKQSTRLLYNSIMTSFFEESIDFVAMHYLVSARKEKFWQQARKIKRPIQMDYYNKKLKDPLNYKSSEYNFFGGNNWVTWLRQT